MRGKKKGARMFKYRERHRENFCLTRRYINMGHVNERLHRSPGMRKGDSGKDKWGIETLCLAMWNMKEWNHADEDELIGG